MKKIIIALFISLFLPISSFGQKLTIDSLEFTLRNEVSIYRKAWKGECIAGEEPFRCMEIVVTIENTSEQTILCGNPGQYNQIGNAYYSFQSEGVNYTQILSWLERPRGWHAGILSLKPGKSARVRLLALMPLRNKDARYWERKDVAKAHYPLGWRWKKNEPTNADYLNWFYEILPTMTISVDCVIDDPNKNLETYETYQITASIDPEKVPISTDFEFRGNSESESPRKKHIRFVLIVV